MAANTFEDLPSTDKQQASQASPPEDIAECRSSEQDDELMRIDLTVRSSEPGSIKRLLPYELHSFVTIMKPITPREGTLHNLALILGGNKLHQFAAVLVEHADKAADVPFLMCARGPCAAWKETRDALDIEHSSGPFLFYALAQEAARGLDRGYNQLKAVVKYVYLRNKMTHGPVFTPGTTAFPDLETALSTIELETSAFGVMEETSTSGSVTPPPVIANGQHPRSAPPLLTFTHSSFPPYSPTRARYLMSPHITVQSRKRTLSPDEALHQTVSKMRKVTEREKELTSRMKVLGHKLEKVHKDKKSIVEDLADIAPNWLACRTPLGPPMDSVSMFSPEREGIGAFPY